MTSAPAAAVDSDFEFDALRWAVNYRNALAREFGPFLKGRVLEVGAGIGQFTEHLRCLRAITEIVAVEPNPAFCRQIRAASPGQQVIEGTATDVTDSDWQAIVSVNVLEHISDDSEELSRYRSLLRKQRGFLCLFVPARPEIYAPIDQELGHRRRYTRPNLRRNLEGAGFSLEHLRYFNVAGYFGWWMTFCLLKQRRFKVSAVRLFDRVIFPSVYWVESRLLPPPVGQSLLAVARANA